MIPILSGIKTRRLGWEEWWGNEDERNDTIDFDFAGSFWVSGLLF